MSNLKVNSKTSQLEFKRKHNALVDDVSPESFATKDLSVKSLVVLVGTDGIKIGDSFLLDDSGELTIKSKNNGKIYLNIGNTAKLVLQGSDFKPVTNDNIKLGTSSVKFKEVNSILVNADKLNVNNAYKEFTPSYYDTSGRTREGIYSKAFVTAGILYLVVCDKWKNETSSTIGQSNISITFVFDNDIGGKIYCYNGEKLSDNYTSQQRIAGITYGYGQWLNQNARSVMIKTGKNQLQITLSIPSLTAGEETFVEGRTFIGLL